MTQTFEEFAEELGITATTEPAAGNPAPFAADDGKGPPMYHYRVELSRLDPSDGSRYVESFSYSVGVGIIDRYALDHAPRHVFTGHHYGERATREEFRRASQRYGGPVTLFEESLLRAVRAWATAHYQAKASDLLQCLGMDSRGVLDALSFEEWAAEYGYDTDSRRAEATYRLCQDNTARLAAFLGGRAALDRLTECEEA